MLESPSALLMVAGFLLVLGPLVLVHEFGHYLVGRWFGVKADIFSVGFGRELLGWTGRNGTRWRLSAIPLGGYVQFAGDMNPASQPDATSLHSANAENSHTFHAKPLWQRSLIVLAGPATNLLVAILIFAAFFMAFGKETTPAVVQQFAAESTAREAGLKVGDRIVTANGTKIASFVDLARMVELYPGGKTRLVVLRDGAQHTITVPIADTQLTDQFGNASRVGRIGIIARGTERTQVGLGEAISLSASHSVAIMRMMLTGIGQIVSGMRSVDELGGPVKIAKYSGEQLSLGPLVFVQFVALISINLAFINFLPIPGLDGGHLAMYAAEAVRRKPLSMKGQEWALRTGIAFVLAITVFITINDVASLLAPRG